MSYEGKKRRYFTGTEIVLRISSVILILVSFLIFGGSSYISLIASLIGVTALIFIAKDFNTANLIPSTLSVTTSFMAVFLTFKRSPFYAFWYAANDVILIVLWSLSVAENISYMSVVVCFVAFFANDIYGFANWKKMARRQTTIQTVV